MKKTSELYREEASVWGALSYKDALLVRIGSASTAMKYYAKQAEKHINGDPEVYNKYASLYSASDKARLFNIALLGEIST